MGKGADEISVCDKIAVVILLRSSNRRPALQSLPHLEPLELRMLQIQRSGRIVAGARMSGPEFLRFGPCLEGALALPEGVRGVERVIFRLRSLEQAEFDESGHAVEIGLAVQPNLLKGVLGTPLHPKAVHCNE